MTAITRCAPRCRATITWAAACAALSVLSPVPALAADIGFSSFVNPFPATATNPAIAGRGAGRGEALPAAWGWNYSGHPDDPTMPVYGSSTSYVNNLICIGPAGNCASNNNDGLAGNEYAGWEFLYFRFMLPADAVDVSLHFLTQDADDRHALLLNGTLLGGFKSGLNAPLVVNNQRDAAGLHAVTFTNQVTRVFDDPALFRPGAENVLAFWINNTFSGVSGTPKAHQTPGDPSALYTAGWIEYQLRPVPEPSVPAMLAAGLAVMGLLGRRATRQDRRS